MRDYTFETVNEDAHRIGFCLTCNGRSTKTLYVDKAFANTEDQMDEIHAQLMEYVIAGEWQSKPTQRLKSSAQELKEDNVEPARLPLTIEAEEPDLAEALRAARAGEPLTRYQFTLLNGYAEDLAEVYLSLHKVEVKPAYANEKPKPKPVATKEARRGYRRSGEPKRSGQYKLNEERVRALRKEASAGADRTELAKKYGVAESQITQIIQRKRWGWVL